MSLAVPGVIFNTLEGRNVHLQSSKQEAQALVVWKIHITASAHLWKVFRFSGFELLSELALLQASCLCSHAE